MADEFNLAEFTKDGKSVVPEKEETPPTEEKNEATKEVAEEKTQTDESTTDNSQDDKSVEKEENVKLLINAYNKKPQAYTPYLEKQKVNLQKKQKHKKLKKKQQSQIMMEMIILILKHLVYQKVLQKKLLSLLNR